MLIVHDKRLPDGYCSFLERCFPDDELVPFGGITGKTYDSISCHPDIYMFQLDKRTLIHAPGLGDAFLSVLREKGIMTIPGKEDPGNRYPDTSLYNAVRVGNVVLHNFKYTDPVIVDKTYKSGLRCINVSQGYSRCSVMIAGEDAIITSDKGIADSVRGEGIDTLLVSPGGIVLPGERYGFIGGSSGATPVGDPVFLGDMELHPDSEDIAAFLEAREKAFFSPRDLPLFDAGSMFFLETSG